MHDDISDMNLGRIVHAQRAIPPRAATREDREGSDGAASTRRRSGSHSDSFPRCPTKAPATPNAASQPAPTSREPTSTGERVSALTTTSPASAARGRPPRAADFRDCTAARRDLACVSASPVASGSSSSSSAAAAAGCGGDNRSGNSGADARSTLRRWRCSAGRAGAASMSREGEHTAQSVLLLRHRVHPGAPPTRTTPWVHA